MALRGGMSRRLPGNPVGSILRDLDRRTRTTTRRGRSGPQAAPRDTVEEPEPVKPVPSAPSNTVADVVVTGADGRARWSYPRAFAQPPVLTALPVDQAPADDSGTVLATVEALTQTYAEVRVWRIHPLRGGAAVEPAGPDQRVHVTATVAAT